MKCYNGSSFLPDDLHGSKARTMLPKAECLRDLTDVHATENQNGFLFTSQFTQTSVTQTYATWLISSREFFTALRASPRRGSPSGGSVCSTEGDTCRRRNHTWPGRVVNAGGSLGRGHTGGAGGARGFAASQRERPFDDLSPGGSG